MKKATKVKSKCREWAVVQCKITSLGLLLVWRSSIKLKDVASFFVASKMFLVATIIDYSMGLLFLILLGGNYLFFVEVLLGCMVLHYAFMLYNSAVGDVFFIKVELFFKYFFLILYRHGRPICWRGSVFLIELIERPTAWPTNIYNH